jgi:hypothetical protein
MDIIPKFLLLVINFVFLFLTHTRVVFFPEVENIHGSIHNKKCFMKFILATDNYLKLGLERFPVYVNFWDYEKYHNRFCTIIPTERPPLVSKVSANFLRIESATWSTWRIPYGRILAFLDRSRYYCFQIAPQLYSRGWLDLVPDPLLFFLVVSENRTRDLRICSQELSSPDHRGGRCYNIRNITDSDQDNVQTRSNVHFVCYLELATLNVLFSLLQSQIWNLQKCCIFWNLPNYKLNEQNNQSVGFSARSTGRHVPDDGILQTNQSVSI